MLSPAGLQYLSRTGLAPDTFAEVLKPYPPMPPAIVLGLIATESGGNPDALRFEPAYPYLFEVKKFAKLNQWTEQTEQALQMFSYGLTQVMLAVAREAGFYNHPRLLLQPKTNLVWGTHHLWRQYRRYGSWADAVAAYNYGHVAKTLLKKNYKNQQYVDRVYYYAAEFQLNDGPQVS